MRMRWFLGVLCPIVLHAQTVRDSIVSVSSTRVTRIAPDRASLFVNVEAAAESAAGATARVEPKVRAVTDALKALGATVESERPLPYSVAPTPSMNGFPPAAVPASFTAHTVIRVTVLRIDQLGAAISAALGAGAANSSTITFESTRSDSVRRERTTEALAAARTEAEAIAKALGGRLGALVEVTSGGGPSFSQPPTLNFDGRFSQPTQTPEVGITVAVTVRYHLVR